MLKRKIIFVLLVSFFTKICPAQVCTDLGQNPGTAFPVCGTDNFSQSTVPVCGNREVKGACSTGVLLTDKNPYWYKFTCFSGGTLGFTIKPNIAIDDYDWQLFDITDRDPNDLYTDPSLFVACNWSGEGGLTGASNAGTTLVRCDGLGVPLFSSMPTLIKGHEYLLLVSHFTDSQGGYSLIFGGGSASITDPADPHLKAAKANCGASKVFVSLSKKMKCNSLTPTASEFVIMPASASIIAAELVGCDNGFDMDSIVLTLSNPLPAGNYSVVINNGSDGNTITDNCDRTIPERESVPFISDPPAPTKMDSVTTPGCAPDVLQVVFKTLIKCSSIASDGSDFQLTGLPGVSVIGASGNCSGAFTQIVKVKLSSPIQKGGLYQLQLVNGSDGNTLLNDCDLPSPPAAVSFSAKDTVSALFTYQLVVESCKSTKVNYSHDGRNGVNSWQWNFADIDHSSARDTSITYTTEGPMLIELIVSNGVCTDTALTTIILPDKVKADFEITDIVCPGEIAKIKNNSKGIISSWQWNFGNGNTNSQEIPSDQSYPFPINTVQEYMVSLIVQNSVCSDTAIKKIKVVNNCYIAVPSAFTPNNDGLNDYLYPLNAYKATDLHFRVFNRFGQLLFETSDWTRKWDGTFKGQSQEPGTYVWSLQYIDKDTKRRTATKGTTVLMR